MLRKAPTKPKKPKRKTAKAAGAQRPVAKKDAPIEPEVVNQKLVDEATKHIRQTLERTIFKGMTEVGEYIFDKFFMGDVEAVRSKDPTKDASFRALAGRCGTEDLPISKSWLYNAVGVAIQTRALKADGSSRDYLKLSPSHRVRMLPLRDNTFTISRLAKTAASKGWTVKELKAAVEEELSAREKDGRGRKPLPAIIKVLNASAKAFQTGAEEGGTWLQLAKDVPDEQLGTALKQAGDLHKKTGKLLEALQKKRVSRAQLNT